LKSEKNWFENSIKDLKQTSHYKSYRKEVDNAIGAKELLATWKAHKATNLNNCLLRK
jgi:hypothetical protein